MPDALIKSGLAAAAAVVSLSVQAADMPINARSAPQAMYWSGCYLGYALGYAWARDTDTEIVTATGQLSPFNPTDSASANGVKTGGYLGCNWQLASSFVVGAEGDVEWADLRGSTTFPNSGPPDNSYTTHIDNQSSARGRIGYLIDDRLLLYATVGVAWAHITERYLLAATGQFTDNSTTGYGVTAGAGVDYAVTDRWIGRLEYRYANFGGYSSNAVVYPVFTERHKTHENAFRWGLSYKFW
jgi:outer membrane immunogenic protein